MVKTNEFKELVKQFMIAEAYGACDIKELYDRYGFKHKPRADDDEIEYRINMFVESYSFMKKKECLIKLLDDHGIDNAELTNSILDLFSRNGIDTSIEDNLLIIKCL